MEESPFRKYERLKLMESLGKRHQACTLDNYIVSVPDQAELIGKARWYVSNAERVVTEGIGFVMFGTRGAGKDHVAFALAMAMFELGHTVKYVNGVEMFESLRDGYSDDSSEAAFAEDFISPTFLWISDPIPQFGTLKDYQSNFLYRIIEARYRLGKPIIMTVNASGSSELSERLGPATVDRLKDHSITHACRWESFRKPFRIDG